MYHDSTYDLLEHLVKWDVIEILQIHFGKESRILGNVLPDIEKGYWLS